MKTSKSIFISILILVIGISVSGQTTKKIVKAPDIKFETKTHDYGTIKKGDNGSCEFVFTNVGSEPLILTNVVASCNCTVPTWSKEPIMPGKKGTIKVVYDTKKVGTISKTITVMSNAVDDVVILNIKGFVNE
jgi:hypothetical protein